MKHLNYRISGATGGPTLMLVHGFMSCTDQWLPNIEALGERYRLVLIDLWGHGKSPTPESESAYSVERYVEEFEGIRAAVDAASWAVIGQSYGAGLVLRYAMAKPEVVTHVVVTNSRSAFGNVNRRSPEGRKPANLAEPDLRKLPFHPIHARRFPEHVKAALVASADRMDPETVRLSGKLGGNLRCTDDLDAVQCPILLTNGIFERDFQVEIEGLADRYQHLTIADLEGGHSVNIEAADGFDQAVLSFLQT